VSEHLFNGTFVMEHSLSPPKTVSVSSYSYLVLPVFFSPFLFYIFPVYCCCILCKRNYI